MGVYIDREEAIKCLDGNVLITRQSEAEAVREYFEMVIKRLENLPTIDLERDIPTIWYNRQTGQYEPKDTKQEVYERLYKLKNGERRTDEHTDKRD